MSVSQITTHEARMLDLLPTQFRNKPVIEALISAFATKIQELEDSAWELATLRALAVATGAQLDGLGEILGEERLGRGDADYRAALQVRVTINLSSGQPETMINVLAAITGADKVEYSEFYPASAQLIAINGSAPLNLLENMYSIAPAAVQLIIAIGSSTPFGFALDPGATGFGELGFPTVGGDFSEVIT